MAVTDLTGTKWYFKGDGEITDTDLTANINFTSNSNNYTSLIVHDNFPMGDIMFGAAIVYQSGRTGMEWVSQDYRTIEITGGTDVTNATLIAWLEANATQQTTPTGKTQIGTRAITKKMLGTREITKEVVNGVVVYEKATPSGTLVNLYAGYNYMGAGEQGVKIKVNGIPTSENDFDYRLKSSGRQDRYSVNTLTTGITVNSLYVWSELNSSYINADYVWNIGGTMGKTIPTGYTRAISIDFNESITPLTGQGAGTPQQFNGNIYFNIDFDD